MDKTTFKVSLPVGFGLLALLVASVVLMAPAQARAQSERELCHDKCADTHPGYDNALVAHDPLGGLVCSCVAEDGQIMGFYRRQGDQWMGVNVSGGGSTTASWPARRNAPMNEYTWSAK